MFGATVAIPIILAPYICIADDTLATSEVITTIFFVSGIATLLQTTIGCRYILEMRMLALLKGYVGQNKHEPNFSKRKNKSLISFL